MKNCIPLAAFCVALSMSFQSVNAQGMTVKYVENKTDLPGAKKDPGYRFVMHEAYFPDHAVAGHMFAFKVHLENKGYISPSRSRPIMLILRNVKTGKEYSVRCQADIRHWAAGGGGFDWREMLKLPASIPAGKYGLFLDLPSKYGSLAKDPEYSIRMANEDCWEENTGYNKLNCTLIVQR